MPPLNLGERAPDFNGLLGVDGRRYSSSDFGDKRFLVFIFLANRCPTARVYRWRLEAIQRKYSDFAVQLVAMNSDSQYIHPEESYEEMIKTATDWGFNFPYLKDEDQGFGKGMGAEVTLHAFLLDENRVLRYKGRVDDSRIPKKVTTHDLQNAINDLLAGNQVKTPVTEPFACAIDYI